MSGLARLVWIGLALAIVFVCGCQRSEVKFEYGQAGGNSINGLSLFAEMLREKGHKVIRQRRLSKRMDKVQTIVWAPDNYDPPSREVVGWLEDWLVQDRKTERLLIYVGKGYDARYEYLKHIADNASPKEFEARQREYNQGLQSSSWASWNRDESEKLWYEFEDGPTNPQLISGPWSEGFDPSSVPVNAAKVLVPLESYEDDGFASTRWKDSKLTKSARPCFRRGEVKVNELLVVDEQPFVFELTSGDKSGNRVIVVSNAGFLLNYPLVTDADRRKLACCVVDECIGDVAVLETQWSTPISSGNTSNGQTWAWVAQPPMRYIVPHFLFWGVLYCFVFYPIFGRPKKVEFHPAKSFGSHVKAVGEVMRRSGDREWARGKIEEYNQRNTKQ